VADIGDLQDLAQAYLDACAEALDTIPPWNAALLGAPVRKFVSAGQPVWDCCEQLTVHVPGIVEGDTSPSGLSSGRRYTYGRINHVILEATITRCVPTGAESGTGSYKPPSAASLGAAGVQHNADGWALWNHLFNLQSSGLFLTLCDEVFFEGITSAVPAGGCAGWIAIIRAYLGGYNESLST
jgi:hypothetical protein